MSQTQTLRDPRRLDGPRPRRGWPLTAAGAGLSGLVATLLLDGRGGFADLDPAMERAVDRAAMVAGHLAVVLLLVTAAHWCRRVETRVPSSTAARVVPLGLVASAAVLTHDGADHLGWLGVGAAAGAVAWMALRERTVSRWLGVVSVLLVLHTTLAVVGTGVSGVAAALAPLWLVVVGVGLAVGRSTVVR